MEQAAKARLIDPNQMVTREADGFEIVSPGPGEPMSEMLIRERR